MHIGFIQTGGLQNRIKTFSGVCAHRVDCYLWSPYMFISWVSKPIQQQRYSGNHPNMENKPVFMTEATGIRIQMPKGQTTTEQDHRQNAVHHGQFQFPMGILDESRICLFVKSLVCPIVHQGMSWNKAYLFNCMIGFIYLVTKLKLRPDNLDYLGLMHFMPPYESRVSNLSFCYWWPE